MYIHTHTYIPLHYVNDSLQHHAEELWGVMYSLLRRRGCGEGVGEGVGKKEVATGTDSHGSQSRTRWKVLLPWLKELVE